MATKVQTLATQLAALSDAQKRELAAILAPATATAASGWYTKAQREAGDGGKCTAADGPCAADGTLRTDKSGASHDPSDAHWHTKR